MTDHECFICGEAYRKEGEDFGRAWTAHFRDKHSEPPTEGARPLREEDDGAVQEWRKAAKKMKPEQIGEFVRHLGEDFHHDYGTICHAVVAAALAAAHAMNHGPSGGLSGFQASMIGLHFLRHWNGIEGPFRVVQFEDMLYPQHAGKFEKRISRETMDWLKGRARDRLSAAREKDLPMHPDVRAHMERIAEGIPPFGYMVED